MVKTHESHAKCMSVDRYADALNVNSLLKQQHILLNTVALHVNTIHMNTYPPNSWLS